MPREANLAQFLAGVLDPEASGPYGPRAPGAPRAYPGQAGATPLPMPLPPRPVPLPLHQRGRRSDPRTWAQDEQGNWSLVPTTPEPPLRVRPGDVSPAGHPDFASWNRSLAPPSGAPSSIIDRDQGQPSWASATSDGLGGKLSPFAFGPPSAPDQPVDIDLDAAWGEALRRAQAERTERDIVRKAPPMSAAGRAIDAARTRPPPRGGPKMGGGTKQLLLNSRTMANQQSQAQWGERQATQGPEIDPETGWPIDPLTGQPVAPTDWERRQREEEARRLQEQRAREQGNEWGVRGDRLTFRRRF